MVASARLKSNQGSITYSHLLWLFLLGSMAGFWLEGIWKIITVGRWENHAATVWGPFCIIYGLAAATLYVVSFYVQGRGLWTQFFVCAAVGSSLEYVASWVQELCFGSVSWDYSDQAIHVNGRVSLRMTILWGCLGLAFSVWIFPWCIRYLNTWKGRGYRLTCFLLSVGMMINLGMTAAAVTRWRERMLAIPAENRWDEYLDQHYDNETMGLIFQNMEFQDQRIVSAMQEKGSDGE